MATLTNFPKPAGPSHRQRPPVTIDGYRRAGSSLSQRGTYPSRPGLIAAICVSWTIALVAGVALVWSMT